MLKKVFGFYSLPLYIMVRPISGFYNMKFEKQGTLKIALLNFFMLCISVTFMNQYTSMLVSQRHPLALNSLFDFFTITLALVLFCTANWAITSLTDGEGRFKEIIMTVCYAMTPLVILLIPAAIISNALTMQETGFYFMITNLAIGWFVLLVFIGLLMIHNYTVAKALVMVVLTFISLLIIVFLITLLLTLLQQLQVFIWSVYREISFRT